MKASFLQKKNTFLEFFDMVLIHTTCYYNFFKKIFNIYNNYDVSVTLKITYA